MMDKPTTRRPPAGPGMDDPDPLGSGAALTKCEAITTHAKMRGAHTPGYTSLVLPAAAHSQQQLESRAILNCFAEHSLIPSSPR